MDYKTSRDLAWKMLLKHNIRELPVDVEKICRAEGITLFTYKTGRSFIKALGLSEHTRDNDAFSIDSVIFYNSEMPIGRVRFSIAHELGHIFLHLGRSISSAAPTVYNREPAPNDDPLEKEANIFASRLLAPLSVIQFLNLNSAEEISRMCEISYTAAKYRYSRLCEIRKRNSERRKSTNHGTFLSSKYERAVVANFKEYIDENKKPSNFERQNPEAE